MDREQAVEAIKLYRPSIIAIDGNLSGTALRSVVEHCSSNGIEGILLSVRCVYPSR